MNEPLLELKGVGKDFVSGGEALHILKDISYVLQDPGVYAITGKSGSGKTTLLNIITGLEAPSRGEIYLKGRAVHTMKEEEIADFRKRHIGFIFQFHYLLKDFTALENVLMPAYIAGDSKRAARDKAGALLEEVGLSDRADHYPSQLSGGERQRVAAARALVNEPDFIFADEPTGNLDMENSRRVEQLLFELSVTHNKTLVLVTHDMQLAEKAGTVLALEKGKLGPI